MTLKSAFRMGQGQVTPVNSSCVISYQSLIAPEAVSFSCTVCNIQLSIGPSLHFAIPFFRLTPATEEFPCYDLRKILHGGQRMAVVGLHRQRNV